jgi:hypothetical protein
MAVKFLRLTGRSPRIARALTQPDHAFFLFFSLFLRSKASWTSSSATRSGGGADEAGRLAASFDDEYWSAQNERHEFGGSATRASTKSSATGGRRV